MASEKHDSKSFPQIKLVVSAVKYSDKIDKGKAKIH